MSEWQPIETAPRDGTQIIVAGDGVVDIAHWVQDEGEILIAAHPEPYWERYNNSNWFLAYICGDNWFEPTHWMPLPPPPETRPIAANENGTDDGRKA